MAANLLHLFGKPNFELFHQPSQSAIPLTSPSASTASPTQQAKFKNKQINKLSSFNSSQQAKLVFGFIRLESKSVSQLPYIPDDISNLIIKWTFPLIDKICVGDKVTILKSNTISDGIVSYIGYPFDTKGIRYGTTLSKPIGNHDGSLYYQCHNETHQRRYFDAEPDHGVFVKDDHQILNINPKKVSEGDETSRYTVGDRVNVRYRGMGCIKFIGMLEHCADSGIWYGIELDERKGRHNGTVNGIKYFDCKPQYGVHCRLHHLIFRSLDGSNSKWCQALDQCLSGSFKFIC